MPGEGLAAVLKIDDGADRASPIAFVDILRRARMLSDEQHRRVLEGCPRQVEACSGRVDTGVIRSCL